MRDVEYNVEDVIDVVRHTGSVVGVCDLLGVGHTTLGTLLRTDTELYRAVQLGRQYFAEDLKMSLRDACMGGTRLKTKEVYKAVMYEDDAGNKVPYKDENGEVVLELAQREVMTEQVGADTQLLKWLIERSEKT